MRRQVDRPTGRVEELLQWARAGRAGRRLAVAGEAILRHQGAISRKVQSAPRMQHSGSARGCEARTGVNHWQPGVRPAFGRARARSQGRSSVGGGAEGLGRRRATTTARRFRRARAAGSWGTGGLLRAVAWRGTGAGMCCGLAVHLAWVVVRRRARAWIVVVSAGSMALVALGTGYGGPRHGPCWPWAWQGLAPLGAQW